MLLCSLNAAVPLRVLIGAVRRVWSSRLGGRVAAEVEAVGSLIAGGRRADLCLRSVCLVAGRAGHEKAAAGAVQARVRVGVLASEKFLGQSHPHLSLSQLELGSTMGYTLITVSQTAPITALAVLRISPATILAGSGSNLLSAALSPTPSSPTRWKALERDRIHSITVKPALTDTAWTVLVLGGREAALLQLELDRDGQ